MSPIKAMEYYNTILKNHGSMKGDESMDVQKINSIIISIMELNKDVNISELDEIIITLLKLKSEGVTK